MARDLISQAGTHPECYSTTWRVHSEQTAAFRGMLDGQNGHNLRDGPESVSSRNNGPEMIAWGSENNATVTALPFCADFATMTSRP